MKTRNVIFLILAFLMIFFGFLAAKEVQMASLGFILGGSLIIGAILISEAIIEKSAT